MRCGRRPAALTAAIGLALQALQPQLASARFVSGGATHTVVAGDTVEDWKVVNDSTLVVGPGAETEQIQAETQSHIELNGATVTAGAGGRQQDDGDAVGQFDRYRNQ